MAITVINRAHFFFDIWPCSNRHQRDFLGLSGSASIFGSTVSGCVTSEEISIVSLSISRSVGSSVLTFLRSLGLGALLLGGQIMSSMPSIVPDRLWFDF